MKKISEREGIEIAHKMFQLWKKSLQKYDPEVMAKLYTDDATFLPTLSDKFEYGQKGAEEYFSSFLQKYPDGKIIKEKIQAYDKVVVHSGFYDFYVVGKDSMEKLINARFTLIYQKVNGEWKISHHHSSLKPKEH